MKIRISKIILVVVISMFGIINNVLALDNNNIVDFSRKGSISITLEDKDNNIYIEDAEITLYHVANLIEENHQFGYVYTDEFNDCSVSLDSLEITDLSNCVTNDMDGIKLNTNEDGNVVFESLDLGIYLIMQTNIVDGYSKIDSFLVMIPKVEDNKYVYNIESNPKTEIYQVVDLIVEKVWNTTDNNIPDSIEVGLYEGDKLLDKIVLNKDNNWTYTFERIEKSDGYSVREINVPSGFTDTYRRVENKFIITNTMTLVQTGIRLWLVELLFVVGSILIIVGIICKKRNSYEK